MRGTVLRAQENLNSEINRAYNHTGTDLMYRQEVITEGVESNHVATYVLFRNHLTTLQQV
jgi:hypothetical protein